MAVEIICKNNDVRKEIPLGTSLEQLKDELGVKTRYQILGALVNNKLRELDYQIFKPKTIRYIDISHPMGKRMYNRSVQFLLYKAMIDLYPNAGLRIEHSVPGGWYCEVDNLGKAVDKEFILEVKKRMKELVEQDLPFIRKQLPTEEAVQIYKAHGLDEKVKLFTTRNEIYTTVYFLEDAPNHFDGYLVPSTSYLKAFELTEYYNGFFIGTPRDGYDKIKFPENPQNSKLFKIFREHVEWLDILQVPYVGELNEAIINKKAGDLIKVAEALHEKKIAKIADKIFQRRNEVKVVFIAGPSSSGKTTFCKRLSVQLQVIGFKPVQISLDNYFVDRAHTPRDEKGEYDFEALEAVDIKFFNEQLLDLMNGKEVELPVFNFYQGIREMSGEKIKSDANTIYIIEGIHGLNPKLTPKIEDKYKYKIFVSALTHIGIDKQNPIPSTDNRLIRRIVRDYKTRGYSALDTLSRWESVLAGEKKNIFPYQENADIMFNSALLFELAVLKAYAEPILREVPETAPEYDQAIRLLKFFSYFKAMPSDEIPPTSILREFLGGSSFLY